MEKMRKMSNLEKQHMINTNNLRNEAYFSSLLKESYSQGILNDLEVENIQFQCINFLAYKCEKFNDGMSSSIRVETAETIMESNLYTIGLYLKSLPDVQCAVNEFKTVLISEMYEKGRKLINAKFAATKHLYNLVQKNRLTTINYSYNATLSDSGIGSFLKLYDPDYGSHDCASSVDYQLCNPITDLVGVEYIQKYLENLYLENKFCRNFAAEDIHKLLCGYDEGYKDLLINIFEHVLTAAIGCVLAKRNILSLDISKEEVLCLQNELSKDDVLLISLKLQNAAARVLEELNIQSPSLQGYIEKSLPKLTSNIIHAIKTNTLGKTFVSPANPDSKPKIQFSFGTKMDDGDYRKFIDELSECRFSLDKIAFIQQNVKSLGDLEDILLDVQFGKEETSLVLDNLTDIELAALIKRHPFKSNLQAVDLSEAEETLRDNLKNYIDKLTRYRQQKIFEIEKYLVDDSVYN
jgi:hypothetical protein